ncbi:glycoside hydrolase family 16 protein [Gaetbulibacter sp. M240]|uniref:glycoside hydrolase family 16 protein n=1 Tax=Gaetbulibacter sp. M240 TaxID=3126511 RepID=UPI00374EB63F
MLKTSFYYFNLVILALLSCSSSEDSPPISPPTNTVPSNLALTTTVQGVTSNTPYGDGSGIVNLIAQATNAVSYDFIINDGAAIRSSDGTYQVTFNEKKGVAIHEIKVIAYSETDNSINVFKQVTVSYYDGTAPVWADEFFKDGKPDTKNWTYDLGAGGWGNQELQTYTNSINNAAIENGVLKILAKSDGAGGYTSARLKTENLKEFKYGTLKVRAKLPSSAGTWPAIWMLGSNFDTAGWPHCGEIDIMEQTGTNKNEVLATCHWYNSASQSTASYGLKTAISNAGSQFHVYAMEWSETYIKMYVDNVKYYEIALNSNLPFNNDFFLIMNIAMGGTLGGNVPAGFTQDIMEIDYVRLYQ